MTIKEKLLKIQIALKVAKNQKNTFGGYMYRSCEDILEAAKPLTEETKTLINLYDDIVQIGTRYYVKATAILMDTESDGLASSVAYAREPEVKKGMDESQITGATSSYARKYALNGLFAIDDQKDSDNSKGKKETVKKGQLTVLDVCKNIEAIKTKTKAEEFKVWINKVTFFTAQQKNVMLAKLEEQLKVCE